MSNDKLKKLLKEYPQNLNNNAALFLKEYHIALSQHPLAENFNRYVQPFRFIAKAASWAVYITLAISFGLVTVSLAAINIFTLFILGKSLSLISPNQIQIEMKNWVIKNRAALPYNLTYFKLVAIGLFKSIFKPLSEVEGSKFLSVLLRPIRLIASPLILSLAFLTVLERYITFALFTAVAAISTAIYLASLAVLNTPLFVLDCGKKLKDLFSENVKLIPENNVSHSASAAALANLSTTTATISDSTKPEVPNSTKLEVPNSTKLEVPNSVEEQQYALVFNSSIIN